MRSFVAAGRSGARTPWASAVAILVIIGLAASCSKRGAAPAAGFRPPPMPAETALVTQAPVADRFEAVGTILAGEAITVAAEIDGLVKSLPFREGGMLKKGAVIAQLDDTQLRAEVARAEALRDQAQASYERTKSVVDQQAAAPQDLDDAAATLKVAVANLDLAVARLEKTRIVAPWAGIVGARRVSPGAFVRAGQEITDLAAVQEIKVSFSVPERYLGVLQRGAGVTISTPAFPGEQLEGRIDVVEPVLDPNLRNARVLARVDNPDNRLRPGMSANVSAILSQRAEALTVPSEAIFVQGDQSFVYVVGPDSSVARAAVVLGSRTADRVEIKSGLTAGARVVRTGHQKLFDGAKVVPVDSSAPAPGAAAAAAGAPPASGAAADPAPGDAAASTGGDAKKDGEHP